MRTRERERERRTESSSNSLSCGASNAAPALEGRGGAGAANTRCKYCHGLPIDPPCNHCTPRPIDQRVADLQIALCDLEEQDGWGEDGPYADPFDHQLQRVGYWTPSGTANENMTPAETRQANKVCDELETWLAGTLLDWMPGRSLGPQANGNTP